MDSSLLAFPRPVHHSVLTSLDVALAVKAFPLYPNLACATFALLVKQAPSTWLSDRSAFAPGFFSLFGKFFSRYLFYSHPFYRPPPSDPSLIFMGTDRAVPAIFSDSRKMDFHPFLHFLCSLAPTRL